MRPESLIRKFQNTSIRRKRASFSESSLCHTHETVLFNQTPSRVGKRRVAIFFQPKKKKTRKQSLLLSLLRFESFVDFQLVHLVVNPLLLCLQPLCFLSAAFWSHQTLDLRSLVVDLSVPLDFSHDDVVPRIVLLGEAEQFSDLRCSLWAKSVVNALIRKSRNFFFALLQHGQMEDGNIGTNLATAHRFSLPLTLTTRPIAGMTFCQ